MNCVVCTQPSPNAYLCSMCGSDLSRDLKDAVDLAGELETTICRQDRIGGGNEGRRSAERPLPWKEPASEASYILVNVLTTWARDLAETRQITLDVVGIAGVAQWLHDRVDWLRQHQAAEELFGEILDAVRQARRAVDRPAVLPYVGRCLECQAHMYARMDKPSVTCKECSHVHDTEKLREALFDAIAAKNLTLSELSRYLPSWLGKPLPIATLKSWVHRRKLYRSGRDLNGVDTYRVQDVMALLGGETRRAS